MSEGYTPLPGRVRGPGLVTARGQGTGIAGAADYQPASEAPSRERRCYVCGADMRDKAGHSARVLPPLVECCSPACADDPRWTADLLLEVTDSMLFAVVKEFRRLNVKVPPQAYLRQAMQAAMKVKRAEWPRRGNG